jgi:pimeloyl-ACP methyl ester carboxylesterase
LEYKINYFENTKYTDIGQGKPIVFLHGLFGSLSNFDDILLLLKDQYRLLLPQLPLYQGNLNDANLDSLIAFVHRFVASLQLNDITIVGNSLGGHLSLLYTLKYKERVKSIVLTGSSGLFENSFGNTFPKKDKAFLKTKIETTFGDKRFATDDLVDNVYDIVNNREKAIRVIKLAKSATRQNLQRELGRIECPTLLIWGRKDTITPPEVALEFDKLIPHTTLHYIDEVGHVPMMEAPETFALYLKQFLKQVY